MALPNVTPTEDKPSHATGNAEIFLRNTVWHQWTYSLSMTQNDLLVYSFSILSLFSWKFI